MAGTLVMPDTLVKGDANPVPGMSMSQFAAALVPLTPVKFTGRDAWLSYVRIAVFGAAGVALWKKNRTIAYVLLGSAAISAGTSFMAGQ